MDIKDFLLARIAEDEAAVAKPVTDLPVTRVHHPHAIKDVPGHLGATVEIHAHDRMEAQPVAATYSADPARILAECAAKRAIIGTYAAVEANRNTEGSIQWHEERALLTSVRALAAIYSDHRDYQEEWKP